ncbi:YARHG domain-containing protein [Clostridium sp. AM58-1XD]|uniref:YARHG domain-containing protein n=1 Tax=Clostridium sp. AM58-1XD TaxID=2292307 RepID=UPI000E47C982|nr:YARHG domain-containing protein [Clostridium sp. AM58-1XD]RGY98549.1 YARHG domain-containing protein [Clostridium sp. AM58-1XD]
MRIIILLTVLFGLYYIMEKDWKRAFLALIIFLIEFIVQAPLTEVLNRDNSSSSSGVYRESAAGSGTEKMAGSSDYIFQDSNIRKLTQNELKGKSSWELRIARNEIFARHGRQFADAQLQKYFENCSWYNGKIDPNNFNFSEMLNEYEKNNIKLISEYEKQCGYQ